MSSGIIGHRAKSYKRKIQLSNFFHRQPLDDDSQQDLSSSEVLIENLAAFEPVISDDTNMLEEDLFVEEPQEEPSYDESEEDDVIGEDENNEENFLY